MKKLECKINDIKAVPNTTMQIVSVNFKIGQREWNKAFRLNYDRPISMEEFKREVVRAGPFPEDVDDFLAYVKEEADQPFQIEVEDLPENLTENVE